MPKIKDWASGKLHGWHDALKSFGFGPPGGGATGPAQVPLIPSGPDGAPRSGAVAGGGGRAINYEARIGGAANAWRNSSVFTALNWLRRNFPDARIGVQRIGKEEIDLTHELALLLANPNPYYSYSTLAAGAVLSYVADGNAYLLPVFDGYGKPVELYWRPHWMLTPVRKPGSGNYIDGYWYKPDQRTEKKWLEPREVIHLRNGIDPDNELKGMSDLKQLLLTLFTEQQASRVIAAMLGNLGMAGAIFKHKPREIKDEDGESTFATLSEQKAQKVKDRYEETFTGEGIGGAMVLDGDWEVDFPTVGIDATLFEKAKDLSQADIAAAIGIPPVVVGWHIGLKTATAKASHEDARKQAYRECLMPMQRSMAEDLTAQALPLYSATAKRRYRVVFDYAGVPTLADDANAKAVRWRGLYKDGIAKLGEARSAVGLSVEENEFDTFYQPPAGAAPADGATADPAKDPAAPAADADPGTAA